MKEADLQILIEQTQDLSAVAFLRDVISFVKEIKPVLENINSSISENVQKMPTATKKLSKVTEATEVATTEILNVVDGIFVKSSQIKKTHIAIVKFFLGRKNLAVEYLKKLKTSIINNTVSADELAELDGFIKILESDYSSFDEFSALDKQLNDRMTALNDDLTAIMMSLQVQDITSQQIAAVNHLLETIQVRLSKILTRFRESELAEIIAPDGFDEEVNISTLHRAIAFDPEALDAISRKDSRQEDVDALLGKVADGTLTDDDMKEDFSTDDIDALFAGSGADNDSAETSDSDDQSFSADDIDALFGGGASTPTDEVSQDDIDALFGGGSASEEASEDDIDALFAK
jgi:chemotaxis regulatin CheY-phosphate phosphatase CheZ